MPNKPASSVKSIGHDVSLLTPEDLFLFNEGNHYRLFDKLGCHPAEMNGVSGCSFGVWAPNAEGVYVIGDFNGWNRASHPMRSRGQSGIWECFIPGIAPGSNYKYYVVSRWNGYRAEKADPFAFYAEVAPKTASVAWDLSHAWHDQEWMQNRQASNGMDAPISIYEVHLGSWRRVTEEGHRSLSYREIARPLAEYCREMGFTHVEFMPLLEHPFYGSWGYQCTGYFAPTSRYGTPQDFMFLVETLHQHGIGVILDWVPSHFPRDGHGLSYFDGTHLYEHADPRVGLHPDWDSLIFNYGRHEVRSFLLSSALFWLEKYHLDGLRVDAVASMLYLDYSRKPGEWIPNRYGGRENLDAISFIRRLNEVVYGTFPDVQMIAEESTDWPMVSRPTYVGGLGFGMKWDMGWMHDTLHYLAHDPVFRKYHHHELTFRILYAFTENFILSLSHDEVVHGKGSLLAKMPGYDADKFASLRLLYGYMLTQPGKKLLFMGCEFGQWREWNHDTSLDWHLLEYEPHRQMQRYVSDLNRLYRSQPALYEVDFQCSGFEWVDLHDWEQSILCYLRRGKDPANSVLVACNFTPVLRTDYIVGVPEDGYYRELLNSAAAVYGGSNLGNGGGVHAQARPSHGRPFSLRLVLPPLSVTIFRRE
jgi:1,4-alpha-glucan branching enzyme